MQIRQTTVIVLLAALLSAGALGGVRPAEARPKYKSQFEGQYPQVRENHTVNCLVCHAGQASDASKPDFKRHNVYGTALKRIVRKNETDPRTILAALKRIEAEAGAAPGKSFGELLEAGTLPASTEAPAAPADQSPSPELPAGTPSARKPTNFVFFLVDDLGYMDVGCNNPGTFYETPNVDRLAASGLRFTDGYAANPVCSPTRYSIMTGKYPTRVGATNFFSGTRAGRFHPAPLNNRMPLDEVTIAKALKEGGYATFFAGKWHLGPTPEFWPEQQGFDFNLGGCDRGGPNGGRKYFSPYGNPRLTDGPPGEHLPDRLARETTQFIESHRDQPFFAYLAFYSVHTPLMAPEDLVAKYRAKAERLGLAANGEFADEQQVWPTDEPRRVRTVQSHAVYAAMVESMDRAVGRVLDALDEFGLAETTAVFFMSDNGGLSTSEGSPTSNLPLRGGKGWLYEGGIREPFLIRWPGVTQPGSTCRVPVISTDFAPTILEIAGVPPRPDQHRDGMSLVPLLRGGTALDRDALFWHYPHYSNQGGMPGGAIRAGEWKLIESFEDGRVQLYNLADDLGERHDLAGQHPDRVAALRGRLHAWYAEVGAKFLEPQPGGPQPWRP